MCGSEIKLFERLEFPYTKEVKDLKSKARPNLQLGNVNKSFYGVLKDIRNDLIYKKLKDKAKLWLDRYISDIAGVTDINIDQYYPPEDIEKLTLFLNKLKEAGISDIHYNSVVYYILKDFSFDAAENFIKIGSDKPLSDMGNLSLTCKIGATQYDFINSLYFFDRFNSIEAFRHLENGSRAIQNPQFIEHLIRFSNILPYEPYIDIKKITSLNDIRTYINIKSTHGTSYSVMSVISNFSTSILLLDLDILFIYLNALTDVSPLNSILLLNELIANYQPDSLPISIELITKIIVKKLFIKTSRERDIMRQLYLEGILSEPQFNQIFNTVTMFEIYNIQHSPKIELILYNILLGVKSNEEKLFITKYPHYFNKLDENDDQVKSLIRDFLILKTVSGFIVNPDDLLSLTRFNNTITSPDQIRLSEIAQLFENKRV
ncbi:hypothetical protein BN7_2162 [Wickerhamomyces ciferrii]|uniref:ELYS-like domain-containing protein n=1 Tax=Wickerhamomyces ciferrii (strain ATCC 14091 / BCRC 22168 / CBS 111 / JCM 3599 / NBRC 0793 / NRRL Y-1031 F-60-10) TaxID=1206466 RepID=K0KNC0_WICCF|nr:uncharacterized protein BN7_2162 [Wickerhamomyces ciferrii]CCH42618.1 hypothetical protein BN7_2162 [Wickerhamomyces ciferrii]